MNLLGSEFIWRTDFTTAAEWAGHARCIKRINSCTRYGLPLFIALETRRPPPRKSPNHHPLNMGLDMRAYLRVDCGGISCTKNSIARSEGLGSESWETGRWRSWPLASHLASQNNYQSHGVYSPNTRLHAGD